MKNKLNQNWSGFYRGEDGEDYRCSSTNTQLTVFNAPVWRKGAHGWVKDGQKTVTVGVASKKDFDFDALLSIAISSERQEIDVA